MSKTNQQDLFNRIKKNRERFEAWAKAQELNCYRLYDFDIPEHKLSVERFDQHFVVSYKERLKTDSDFEMLESRALELSSFLQAEFAVPEKNIHLKIRRPQKPNDLYQRLATQNTEIEVQERNLKFWVNLDDYLDTGLFLDHRPWRKILATASPRQRVLNLFSYTCSLSVAAASAGHFVTSVDLSKTYLDWGQRNFILNNISTDLHRFFRQDAVKYLAGQTVDQYDLILLDPPSFSKSKRMQDDLDIETDQSTLIDACMKRLKASGTLLFSTNRGGFQIDPALTKKYKVADTTKESTPEDFSYSQPHKSYKISPAK
jgi:23S rRNA G2069 N7-methylase RlmK/C1962 C5-methylase RlmI